MEHFHFAFVLQEQIVVQPQRYEIEIKKGESKLLVHKLTEADSGLYYCEAVYAVSTTMAHVELRVSARKLFFM